MRESDSTLDAAPITGSLDLDQYFGLWAVEDTRFLQMFQQVQAMDLAAHVRIHAEDNVAAIPPPIVIDARTFNRDPQGSASGVPADKKIAVIDINGTLTKRGSSMSAAGSTIRLRQAVRAAARDESVGAILLRIDSPGGTVAGTADLGDEIAAAAKDKPCWAYCEDLCASAAYWLASQCDRVVANNATALVGSIGTFIGLYDVSGAAAMQGIKAVVIKSGALKGAGFPGTEITEAQKADWQSIVDRTQEQFSAAVARGRKLSAERVAELADGRVHTAAEAQKLGLVDAVDSWQSTVTALFQAISESEAERRATGGDSRLTADAAACGLTTSGASPDSSHDKETPMSETTTPRPASYQEIEAGLPGADAAFLCSQLKTGATLAQAQTAWMSEQNKRLEAAQQTARQATEAAAAAAKKPGVEALGNGTQTAGGQSDSGDPIAQFNEAVAAEELRTKNRPRAVSKVIAKNPALHKAYLTAYNVMHGGKAPE